MLTPVPAGGSHAARLARYAGVSTALALLSDRRLRALVDDSPLVSSGIGGSAMLSHVEGTPVFVKRVPLTDLERRPEHVMSTANLFELPTFFQYGVGSAGFGVWRELAAAAMTTGWVLSGQCDSFPLMYHWRILSGPPPQPATSEERARTVEYWHGSPAVRTRLDAIARSSASVLLFFEYVPQNLRDWLTAQAAAGDDAVESACAMVERDLRTAGAFLHAAGLLHFDAHFGNVLTDGRRLYLADLGLATSPRFELTAAERDFVRTNRTHDRCHTMTELVNWLVTALSGAVDRTAGVTSAVLARNAYIRRCAESGDAPDVLPGAAAIIGRYAPIAAVVNDFYWKLHTESRTTPYPADELRVLLPPEMNEEAAEVL